MRRSEDYKIRPMLIGHTAQPFDSENHVFELKLDGERCIAYLSGSSTELVNKRDNRLGKKFPELAKIHKLASAPCVLDGELIVSIGGKPNFKEVARRSILTSDFKIQLGAEKNPATFVAFDILYLDGESLMNKPLRERKKLLAQTVRENERLAVSRFIETEGKALFSYAQKQDLEGIVAKPLDSIYVPNTRTAIWSKIKNQKDDDYVICGYIENENNGVSLFLGQYGEDGDMYFKGNVTLGKNTDAYSAVAECKTQNNCPFLTKPKRYKGAVWLRPKLVCTVKFMLKEASGALRHPVFKSLRHDKLPSECIS